MTLYLWNHSILPSLPFSLISLILENKLNHQAGGGVGKSCSKAVPCHVGRGEEGGGQRRSKPCLAERGSWVHAGLVSSPSHTDRASFIPGSALTQGELLPSSCVTLPQLEDQAGPIYSFVSSDPWWEPTGASKGETQGSSALPEMAKAAGLCPQP